MEFWWLFDLSQSWLKFGEVKLGCCLCLPNLETILKWNIGDLGIIYLYKSCETNNWNFELPSWYKMVSFDISTVKKSQQVWNVLWSTCMYIKNGKHAIFIKTLKIILDLFLFFFVFLYKTAVWRSHVDSRPRGDTLELIMQIIVLTYQIIFWLCFCCWQWWWPCCCWWWWFKCTVLYFQSSIDSKKRYGVDTKNQSYKPGGGNIQVFSQKIDTRSVTPRTDTSKPKSVLSPRASPARGKNTAEEIILFSKNLEIPHSKFFKVSKEFSNL